jgi:hypothetical protein
MPPPLEGGKAPLPLIQTQRCPNAVTMSIVSLLLIRTLCWLMNLI